MNQELIEVPPIPRKPNLYDLDAEVVALEAQIAAAEGEAADELIDAYLKAGGDLRQKLEGYGRLRAEALARAKARKEESRRLADLAKSDEAIVSRLEARLKRYMEDKGVTEIQANSFKFSVVGVGGKQAVVLDVAPEKMPYYLRRRVVTYEADKEQIHAFLSAGKRMKWAHLEPKATRLSVR